MSSFMVRWLKLSLVVIVGCGFLAMMIYALVNRDEISTSQVEPPLISPPSEPLKRRPDQPGGMQIPNRDKLVFDLLDSSNTELGDTGVAMSKDVTPTANVTGAVAQEVSDSVAAVEAVGMDVETTSATDVAPAAAPTSHGVSIGTLLNKITPPAVPVSSAQVAMKPAVVAVAPKVEVKVPEIKPVEKIVEKPVAKPVEKVPEPKVVVAGGKWGVQLAAVNTVADGNAMTAKLAKEFTALKGLSPRVAPVPGGKRYRVQFVGAKDRDAASAICAKLAGKQPCFPVQ